jgi:hypothetical protein
MGKSQLINRESNMKIVPFITLLVCALLASISLGVFYYTSLVYNVQYIPLDMKVSTVGGINADTDALHFGKVTSPGGGDRYIIVSNDYNVPLAVLLSARGNITTWLSLNESRFILDPAGKRAIKVSMNLPSGVEQGTYNGTLKILFRRLLI